MSSDLPPSGGPAPYEPPDGVAPYDPESPAAVQRPQSVDIAFWLYLAAAAFSLIGLIISFASIHAVREEAFRQLEAQGDGELIPPEAVEGAIWMAFALGTVFALVVTAAYVVLANVMRRGHGWARIVLAVLAALAIFGILGGFGVGALQFLCLAAATVLVFLPTSNAYFRAAAERRRGMRPA